MYGAFLNPSIPFAQTNGLIFNSERNKAFFNFILNNYFPEIAGRFQVDPNHPFLKLIGETLKTGYFNAMGYQLSDRMYYFFNQLLLLPELLFTDQKVSRDFNAQSNLYRQFLTNYGLDDFLNGNFFLDKEKVETVLNAIPFENTPYLKYFKDIFGKVGIPLDRFNKHSINNREAVPLTEVLSKLDILLYKFTTLQYKNQLGMVKPYFVKLYNVGRKVEIERFIRALRDTPLEDNNQQQRKEAIARELETQAEERREAVRTQGNFFERGPENYISINGAIALIDPIYNGNFPEDIRNYANDGERIAGLVDTYIWRIQTQERDEPLLPVHRPGEEYQEYVTLNVPSIN